MRKFTDVNISKLYISPYVSFHPAEDSILIRQRIFGCQIRIPGCAQHMLDGFIEGFRDGLNEEEAKEQIRICFPGNDSEEILMELMRAGVLE